MLSRRPVAPPQHGASRLVVALLLAAVIGTAAPARPAGAANGIALVGGWTHHAGTAECLASYNKGTGELHLRSFADGRLDFNPIFTYDAGWSRLAGTGSHLVFYDVARGEAVFHGLENGCGLGVGKRYSNFGTWTHVIGIGEGVVLFYNKATGARKSGWVDFVGTWNPVETIAWAGGWTHIVAAGSRVIFYKAGSEGSNAATGVFDADGRYTNTTNGGFAANWTHLIGTRNGGLIFYDKRTGKGMSGRLDAGAAWDPFDTDVDFGKGWTQAAGGGARSVLFYKRNAREVAGSGVGGFVTDAGRWRRTTGYVCSANCRS